MLLATRAVQAYPGAPTGVVTEEARGEAKQRVARALKMFDEGDGEGAVAELTRAWELTGSPAVLYNLGLVQVSLGRWVAADAALTEVLALSPDPLKPAQRARAIEAQQKARTRIGTVVLVPKLPEGSTPEQLAGAIVEVDGVEAGRWPLGKPLRVGNGKHAVGLVATGFAPLRREVIVAGETTVDVEMPLVRMEGKAGQLTVAVSVPDANVLVDGGLVGTSPLTKGFALPPGKHTVEATRPGYTTASTIVTLAADTTAQVSLNLIEDPAAVKALGAAVLVVPSESAALVEIDGVARPTQVLLPPGSHTLHVEKSGFLSSNRSFMVTAGTTTTVKVALVPTPETLESHDASVSFHRTWGLVGVGSGALLATVGAVLFFPGRALQADVDARAAAHDADTESTSRGGTGTCHQPVDPAVVSQCAATAAGIDADRATARWKVGVGLPLLIGGGALLGTGVVLLLTGPSSHRFDAVRPEIGLGWVGATVVF